MEEEKLQQIRSIAEAHPEVKLVYLFGSKAKEASGPLSDYDLAVVTDGSDRKKNFELKLTLSEKIRRVLETDAIDVVMMNEVDAPELKYAIISEGKLLFERGSYRVLVEPKVLNEYFDFMTMLRRNQLTHA